MSPIPSTPEAAALPRVAYQGECGAFSEAAVLEHWRGAAIPVATRSFAALFAALHAGEAEFGLLPVWNSTIGDIAAAHGLLAARGGDVEVVSQVELPVRHCLLGFPGVTVESLRVVGSHPAALGQCRGFFARHPWLRAVEAYDTAGAARELALHGHGAGMRGGALHDRPAPGAAMRIDGPAPQPAPAPWCDAVPARSLRQHAVLASIAAASRYGLTVIAEGVQDDPANCTRFVAIRRAEAA
jgi:prephenate dehydratase